MLHVLAYYLLLFLLANPQLRIHLVNLVVYLPRVQFLLLPQQNLELAIVVALRLETGRVAVDEGVSDDLVHLVLVELLRVAVVDLYLLDHLVDLVLIDLLLLLGLLHQIDLVLQSLLRQSHHHINFRLGWTDRHWPRVYLGLLLGATFLLLHALPQFHVFIKLL